MIAFGWGNAAVEQVRIEPQHPRKVDFQVIVDGRAGARKVEPPARPIGQDAPAQRATGQVVDPPQVAQELGRRRVALFAFAPLGTVQRAAPALAFDNRRAEFVALPFFGVRVRLGLCPRVDEQQAIGNVDPPGSREVLLGKVIAPAEQREDRPDKIAFRGRFIRAAGVRETGQDRIQPLAQGLGINRGIGRRGGNAFGKVVLGEKRASSEEGRIVHTRRLPCAHVRAKALPNQ